MHDTQALLAQIEERLKFLGMSQAQLGLKAFGKADNTAIQSLKKGSSPSVERMSAIASALGLELYIGPPRESGPVEQLLLEGTDFAPVHRLNVSLSAGPGAENGEAAVIETMAFRRDWLGKMNVSPESAVLVKVTGNSMLPGLHDGDMALVDTAQTTIRSGQIYAVTDIDAQTLVKRIDTLDGEGLLLRSDNPDFAPIIRQGPDANRVTIHGRVVWSGHVWR